MRQRTKLTASEALERAVEWFAKAEEAVEAPWAAHQAAVAQAYSVYALAHQVVIDRVFTSSDR